MTACELLKTALLNTPPTLLDIIFVLACMVIGGVIVIVYLKGWP